MPVCTAAELDDIASVIKQEQGCSAVATAVVVTYYRQWYREQLGDYGCRYAATFALVELSLSCALRLRMWA
jgi:hypothetical protein